jgi:hypothetical protein
MENRDTLSRREVLGGLVAGLCGGLFAGEAMGEKPPPPQAVLPDALACKMAHYLHPRPGSVVLVYDLQGQRIPRPADRKG